MRLQLRDGSGTLPQALRVVARDRIRLALGRHAASIEAVRASFRRASAPRQEGRREGRLVLSAVLVGGGLVSVESRYCPQASPRFERFVDRQALRLGRAIERSLGVSSYPAPQRRAASGPAPTLPSR